MTTHNQTRGGDGWIGAFPDLAALPEAERRVITDVAQKVALPAGAPAFRQSDVCERYVFVVDGCVRVQMVSESGREILLYRVSSGETCILTTSCLLGEDTYPAEAVAEVATTAALLPRREFDRLVDRSAAFRHFVFAHYGRRLTDLMRLLDEVAFQRIDVRLARLLVDRGSAAPSLPLTHQELAVDLGSAREVVSRQLKEFERRGWVTLGRGRIEVRDIQALRGLADDHP